MKIKVLGNCYTYFPRENTHFMINDDMLLDTPQGCSKNMIGKIDFKKIKYILITHFHSDHFAELHLLFEMIQHEETGRKVKIVAPKGAKRRLHKLFRLLDAPHSMKKIQTYFEFVELKPNQTLQLENYQIETFKTEHHVKHSLGFTLQEGNGKVVGFTGDTFLCDGLFKLIEKRDIIFIDTTSTKPHPNHLTMQEVKSVREKFPDKLFFSVHASPEIIENHKKEMNVPEVGQKIEI